MFGVDRDRYNINHSVKDGGGKGLERRGEVGWVQGAVTVWQGDVS